MAYPRSSAQNNGPWAQSVLLERKMLSGSTNTETLFHEMS